MRRYPLTQKSTFGARQHLKLPPASIFNHGAVGSSNQKNSRKFPPFSSFSTAVFRRRSRNNMSQ
jgi:hypothetical protein